jgi:UDP-2,3-diacylglucosamine pyrophosphatase LpxH
MDFSMPDNLAVWPDVWQREVRRRLSAVLETAHEVLFDDASRLVFFSDCHRGNRSRNDAFAANEPLFMRVLTHYFHRDFTYIEVGDGDELWQNHRFKDVLHSHRPIFDLLHRFDLQERLHLILGNHDVAHWRQKNLSKDGIQLKEGLTLRHRRTNQRILVTHGHQADIKSDLFSSVSRLVVRHIWRRIQTCEFVKAFRSGFDNRPLFPSIERRIMAWAAANRQPIICGHTHRAMAAEVGEPGYFNTGSFIVPNIATGLEIQGGEIALVRWTSNPVTREVRRQVLAPARRLALFA